jgi:cation diffusion facilitator CzcD-associated flavoprotein CzcO
VVVVGSGATAITLIPAMARDAAHVTMLQRSPTYVAAMAGKDPIGPILRKVLPKRWGDSAIRWMRAVLTQLSYVVSKRRPALMKRLLIEGVKRQLPEGYDVATHFTPRYDPWDQRLCVAPDGDLFTAIREGRASVVTDHIDTFTRSGIRLASGEELDADIVVTATGFNLSVLGDIDFTVDDEPLVFSDTVTYRGVMFTGVPNLAYVFGYFRASWTLRLDLVADFVCRLLEHMRAKGAKRVDVRLRPQDSDMSLLPWIDPESFNPGYMMRSLHLLPKRGDKPEWAHTQDYWTEKDDFAAIDLDDKVFVYSPA